MRLILLFLLLPFFSNAQVTFGIAKGYQGNTEERYYFFGNVAYGDMAAGLFSWNPTSTLTDDSVNCLRDGTYADTGRFIRDWQASVKQNTVTATTTRDIVAEETFIPVN